MKNFDQYGSYLISLCQRISYLLNILFAIAPAEFYQISNDEIRHYRDFLVHKQM